MSRLYRILMIEDDQEDAELLKETLDLHNEFNYDLEVTESLILGQYSIQESSQPFDVVILDLGLRTSSGLETYKKFKALKLGLPVIISTGLNDEETAIRAISEGAQDYLVKGTMGSGELVRSIIYTIQRFGIETKLQESELKYRNIYEATTDALLIHDKEGKILEANPTARQLYKYTTSQFTSLKLQDLTSPQFHEELSCALCSAEKGISSSFKTDDISARGELIHTIKTIRSFDTKSRNRFLAVIHDITEVENHRNMLEQKVKERTAELEYKYKEMEKIYKLMIGREHRIKELRDEIKKLKSQIK